MIYLYAAYSMIWLLLFGYIWSLHKKEQNLQRQLEELRRSLQEDGHTGS